MEDAKNFGLRSRARRRALHYICGPTKEPNIYEPMLEVVQGTTRSHLDVNVSFPLSYYSSLINQPIPIDLSIALNDAGSEHHARPPERGALRY